MKKLLFSLLFAASLALTAQNYSTPPASLRQFVDQQLSISNIKVDYGRPAVKEREIFVKLVPCKDV